MYMCYKCLEPNNSKRNNTRIYVHTYRHKKTIIPVFTNVSVQYKKACVVFLKFHVNLIADSNQV